MMTTRICGGGGGLNGGGLRVWTRCSALSIWSVFQMQSLLTLPVFVGLDIFVNHHAVDCLCSDAVHIHNDCRQREEMSLRVDMSDILRVFSLSTGRVSGLQSPLRHNLSNEYIHK